MNMCQDVSVAINLFLLVLSEVFRAAQTFRRRMHFDN